MRPIAISLSPNTEPDDIAVAQTLLSKQSTWSDTSSLDKITTFLEERFGGTAVLFSAGRTAITAALQAAGITKGDEVIIQGFTCSAVSLAVILTGATPVYVDIDSSTYSVDAEKMKTAITSKTKVIILQHTFGIPGPIDAVLSLARQHNLLVIEDCAHSLGATSNGQPLGTAGDITILSFGRDKMLSCVFGGAAIARNPEIANKVEEIAKKKSQAPTWWVKQQLRHPIIFQSVVQHYFTWGKYYLRIMQMFKQLSLAVAPAEKLGQKIPLLDYAFHPALGQLLWQQLQKLDRYTTRRTEIVKKYDQAFGTTYNGPLLRYPILVKDPALFLQVAKQRHMLLGDWYHQVVAPAGVTSAATQYQAGTCPTAEEVVQHVVNLPTYPLLLDAQVEQVITFVKEYQSSHE